MITLTKLKKRNQLARLPACGPPSILFPIQGEAISPIGFYYRHPACQTLGKYPSKTINNQCF